MSHHGNDLNQDNASDDSLIDSLLEEHLGGKTPPDLSKQILARLEREKEQQDVLVSTRRTAHARQYRSVRSKMWTDGLMATAAIVTMACVAGMIAWNLFSAGQQLANEGQLDPESQASESGGDVLNDGPLVTDDRFARQLAVDENHDTVPLESETSNAIASSQQSSKTDETVPVQYFADSKYDRSRTPRSLDEIVANLDDEFQRQWQEQRIAPSPPVSDEIWLDRVFDRMIGRLPTQDESNAFQKSKESTKRTDIVVALTTADKYKSEFHAHWTSVLESQLLEVDASPGTIKNAVERDMPFNQLLAELVATSTSDLNRVCQSLIGARTDCAKCHSELGPTSDRLELFADGFNHQRKQFSQAIAESDDASETLVNNLWSHFFGPRLTPWSFDPNSGDAPILEPTLHLLTKEFIACNYDTKQLATWITLSKPFCLSSQRTVANESDSAIATEPLFARHYRRRTFATSIAESLAKFRAADIDLIGKNANPVNAVASVETRLNGNGKIKKDETVWQDISFMNSDPDRARILMHHKDLLTKLATSNLSTREKVDHIFLLVAGRMPTRAERGPAIAILRSQKTNAMLGLRDVWWAISNGQ